MCILNYIHFLYIYKQQYLKMKSKLFFYFNHNYNDNKRAFKHNYIIDEFLIHGVLGDKLLRFFLL